MKYNLFKYIRNYLYLLLTNDQNENSQKKFLVVVSLIAILIVGLVLYGFI
jgi:hypothetical protein